MSALALQHVREHLRKATRVRTHRAGFDWVEYQLTEPMQWSDLLLAIQLSAEQGWVCLPEWQSNQTAVTMLRLVRPANFCVSQRDGVSHTSDAARNSVLNSWENSSPSQWASRFREVNSLVTPLPSLKRPSEQSAPSEQAVSEQPVTGQLKEFEKDVEKVCTYYRTLTKKKPSKSGIARVRVSLTYWPADKLIQAIDAGCPKDLFGVQAPPLQELFRTLATVAALLQEPVPKPRPTWVVGYAKLYRERFPLADFPFGPWGKVLKPLIETHGDDRVRLEFQGYLAKTEASYLSAPKFASGFGTWVGKANLTAHDGPVTSKVL